MRFTFFFFFYRERKINNLSKIAIPTYRSLYVHTYVHACMYMHTYITYHKCISRHRREKKADGKPVCASGLITFDIRVTRMNTTFGIKREKSVVSALSLLKWKLRPNIIGRRPILAIFSPFCDSGKSTSGVRTVIYFDLCRDYTECRPSWKSPFRSSSPRPYVAPSLSDSDICTTPVVKVKFAIHLAISIF